MVEAGALDEARALMARGLDPALPAMKAVGVREFAAHLAGETSLGTALAAAQQETRRYAKRQTTWMRGQMADWPRLTEISREAQWRQFLALNPGLTTPRRHAKSLILDFQGIPVRSILVLVRRPSAD